MPCSLVRFYQTHYLTFVPGQNVVVVHNFFLYDGIFSIVACRFEEESVGSGQPIVVTRARETNRQGKTHLKFPFFGRYSLNSLRVGCEPGSFIRYGKSSSKYVYTVTVSDCVGRGFCGCCECRRDLNESTRKTVKLIDRWIFQ